MLLRRSARGRKYKKVQTKIATGMIPVAIIVRSIVMNYDGMSIGSSGEPSDITV